MLRGCSKCKESSLNIYIYITLEDSHRFLKQTNKTPHAILIESKHFFLNYKE